MSPGRLAVTSTAIIPSRLARFAAITAIAFVISRILGLARDTIIAAQVGADYELDAYVLAFTIPDQVFILMSGGALSAAFIPVFARLRNSGDEDQAWRMASGVLGLVGLGVICLAAVAWVFAPVLVNDVIASQSADPRTKELAIDLMRILLFSPLFLSLATVATAILQSYDRFTLPAFAPVAYNSCIILGALLLAPRIGMRGVAVGVVAGSSIFFLMQLPAVWRLGLHLPRTSPLRDPNVRRTFVLLLPRIAGQSAKEIGYIVTLVLAAGLGSGPASAYKLAQTLFVLPIGLFATSLASVTFPAMSREALEKDASGFLYLVRRSIRGVLFFVLPAAAGLIILRYPVARLIYERGEFKPADTALVAEALLGLSVGMWSYALVDVLPRAFYALQDSVTPLKIGIGVVALDILLAIALSRAMGLGGLGLAFALGTMVQMGLLAYLLNRRLGNLFDRATAGFVLRALLATGIMLAALWLARPLLAGYEQMSFQTLLLRVGVTVSGAAAIYMLISLLLGQEEIGTLRRLVRR